MKNLNPKQLWLLLFTLVALVSCSDDDDNPEEVLEQEVITTVVLTVTEMGTTNSTEYTWTEDSQDDVTLDADAMYTFDLQFLDESDPEDVEDITEEVIELADEHFVFYETTVSGLTFDSAAGDTIDSNDIGINLSTDWETGDAGTGIVRAFLIHEPTTKTGTSRDDFGGETDIEVDFNVTVQ